MFLFDDNDNCKVEFEILWEFFEDNLDCIKDMYDTYISDPDTQASKTKQARTITFVSIGIEKLLLLNLYARNPLLLIKDAQINKNMLLSNCNYKHYNSDWVFNHGDSFVSPGDMFEVLTKLMKDLDVTLDNFKSDFEFIKKIRNKYIHSFVRDVPASTFYLVRYKCLYLLIILIESLPQFLNINAPEILEGFGMSAEKIEVIKAFNSDEFYTELQDKFQNAINSTSQMNEDDKRKFFRRLIRPASYWDEELPVFDHNGESVYLTDPEGEEHQDTISRERKILPFEVNIPCSVCILEDDNENTGYIGLDNGGEDFYIDREGDSKWYNEPIHIDILFDYYYCLRCGCHSNESYILKEIGYKGIFDESFGASWDINEGVTDFYLDNDEGFSISV